MTQTILEMLADAGYRIDHRRLERARGEIVGHVRILQATADEVCAQVKGIYQARIRFRPVVRVGCDCPDWRQRGRRLEQPCKHVLGLALEARLPEAEPPAPHRPATSTAPTDFGRRVQDAIDQAVAALADKVQAVIEAGQVPFLIGPTGCGKTSAVRTVATRNGWGFEEVAGAPSFADADLVGIRMAGGVEIAGVFARAFRRARAGETVLLFLDEFTRFNTRAQDILMRPLLPSSVAVARGMGIRADEPVRLIEAPLWGVEWAPVSRARIAMACNPWGSSLDPALIRRVVPIQVAFAPQVLALFDGPVRDAIEASWKAVQGGELPLPVEYGALTAARGPDDRAIFVPYLDRLSAVDRVAAEGFRKVIEGIGVRLQEGNHEGA